jgi:hypothetical protein
MKKNGLILVLILVVAFIWYKAFVKLWSNVSVESTTQTDLGFQNDIDLSKIKRDSFELNIQYQDPFELVGELNSGKVQEEININPKPKSKQTISDKYWPNIIYKGLILKSASNNPLILLKIDGQNVILRLKEKTFDGILAVYADKERVDLIYQNQKKKYWRD